ncbi:MAG: hypothetical protein ACL93V_04315 [Candidatus Electrothrix sp. YB6]
MLENNAILTSYHPDVNTGKIGTTLTFLKPLGKLFAGKQYRWYGDSWKLLSGYGKAKNFRCQLHEVNNLAEWYGLLQRIAEENVFLVMGLPTAAANLKGMMRRIRERSFVDHNGEEKRTPPSLADRAGYLLPFDFDSISCPADLDAIQQPDTAIRWLIETALPVEFYKAGVVYQFSSSFGLTGDKLKVHLFFWLADPVTMSTAKQWAKSYNKSRGYVAGNKVTKTFDDAVYQPQQPIYTKNRVCHGASDPVPSMIGFLPGKQVDFEAVRHAQKQHDKAHQSKNNNSRKGQNTFSSGSGVEYRLSRIGVDGHHEPIRNAAAAIVAIEGKGAVLEGLEHYVDLLREHVEQADRMGKPETEFQQTYCAESYLRQQFQSALNAGFGDNRRSESRFEQQKKAISSFKHKDWLVRSEFPGKTFDLSGDL